MIRVFFAALVLIAVLGALLHIGNGGVFAIFIIAFLLIAAGNVGKLRCPYCRKRVKLNASVCHHCGRDVEPLIARLNKKSN